MGSLARCLALLFWLSSAAASAGSVGLDEDQRIDRWNHHIDEASSRFAIPQQWIRAVIAAESGGRDTIGGRPTMSPAGAMGLMQLMPGTWAEIRARHGLGGDPHQPRDNILAGTAYLREMHDRFGYPGLFAAYNAGPSRYARHLSEGAALPSETLRYLDLIVPRRTVNLARSAARVPPTVEAANHSQLFAIKKAVGTRDGEGGNAGPSPMETAANRGPAGPRT
jgi:soluble lytic murein transglycosylase-like protein